MWPTKTLKSSILYTSIKSVYNLNITQRDILFINVNERDKNIENILVSTVSRK